MSVLLRRGDRGTEVVRLQRLLIDRGIRGVGGQPLAEDGDFGLNTEAAVRAFQHGKHLVEDGKVGPATWAELEQRVIEPVEVEDPSRGGLLIRGEVVPVPGTRVIGPHDAAWSHLSPGDCRPRRRDASGKLTWVRMWIWHKTIADDPEQLIPGAGPPCGARRTADYWATDPKYSGTHLVTGDDGEVACLADLVLTEAFHATVSNRFSVGQETRERPGGKFWEAAANATIATTWTGCPKVGIQLQMHRGPYRGHPIDRMKTDGGADMVGIFGHRDNTEDRGKWDPGELLFQLARARPHELFDFEAGEDRRVWMARQQELIRQGHTLQANGIPGPETVAALKLEGYTDGIWVLGRPNFHG